MISKEVVLESHVHLKLKHKKFQEFFVSSEKSHCSACMQWCVLSNYLGMTRSVLLHSLNSAEIRSADSQSDLRILL